MEEKLIRVEFNTRKITKNLIDNTDNKSNDVHYALQINKWIFSALGVWPISSSYVERICAHLCLITSSLLLAFIIVPGSFFTYVIVKAPDMRLKLTGALSFCVMAIMKYTSFIIRSKNIAASINHIMADWDRIKTIRDREIMTNHAQYGRRGAIICSMFMYSGAVFYAGILPHVSANVKSEKNITIKPLAYPSYYIWFDPQESPAYEIVASIHCCSAFVMHSITAAACSVAVTFIMHAIGQLEILIVWLNDLVDENQSNQSLAERYSQIISHHVRTLRFIVNIETVLCEIAFVEIVGCTANIVLLSYYLMLEWEQSDAMGIMTFSILLISFTCNIFVFSYISERLTEKCREVGETAYMIDWYRIPVKQSLGLTLMISIAQNPHAITAGKLFNLSLNSFCTVIRTSVTYLNLLRTFMM